jgi:hypothetical protein
MDPITLLRREAADIGQSKVAGLVPLLRRQSQVATTRAAPAAATRLLVEAATAIQAEAQATPVVARATRVDRSRSQSRTVRTAAG